MNAVVLLGLAALQLFVTVVTGADLEHDTIAQAETSYDSKSYDHDGWKQHDDRSSNWEYSMVSSGISSVYNNINLVISLAVVTFAIGRLALS